MGPLPSAGSTPAWLKAHGRRKPTVVDTVVAIKSATATVSPSMKLPNQAIAIVHRSDGSGTTYNFAYYLADVSADWKSKVGVNTSVQWPSGIGAKGNEGVANNVGNTKGSIGYVEYAYAKQNKMTYTLLENRAGSFVAPTA